MKLSPKEMTQAGFIHSRQRDNNSVSTCQDKENRYLGALISKGILNRIGTEVVD